MPKKFLVLFFLLVALIILAWFSVDSNLGGVFRTATPTATSTAPDVGSYILL